MSTLSGGAAARRMPTNVESESDDRNDQLTMAISQPSILLKWVAERFLESVGQ